MDRTTPAGVAVDRRVVQDLVSVPSRWRIALIATYLGSLVSLVSYEVATPALAIV